MNLSKQEKALAIAVKDGWDLVGIDENDAYSIYYKKGEPAEYKFDIVDYYQTYNALMPIVEKIIDEYGGVNFSRIGVSIIEPDGESNYFSLRRKNTPLIDEMLDLIYYVLCEANNG